ncbi:MAG: DUF362 domain-containing protein [Chloroflexota bacterium]
MRSRVSLIRGPDRYHNVARALDLVGDGIDWAAKRHVVVKPNFVSAHRALAVTHVDAVRATLDFIRSRYDGPIVLAEGRRDHPLEYLLGKHGYLPLLRQYEVEPVDLNQDDPVPVRVFDRRLRPLWLRAARTLVESDCTVSVTPPKTHDTVIYTGSLKNVIMGALIVGEKAVCSSRGLPGRARNWVLCSSRDAWGVVRDALPVRWDGLRLVNRLDSLPLAAPGWRDDKIAMHQGYAAMNLNLFTLAPLLHPHLAILDGYEAMEGDGPVHGSPVPLRLALASLDYLAADATAARIMGLNPEEIGYLYYCWIAGLGQMDPKDIEVVGNSSVPEVTRLFRPHTTYREQLRWRSPQAARHVAALYHHA